MVKTIVTPDHDSIELTIPKSYVGKQLEVLVYTVDEVESKPIVARLADDKKPISSAPTKPSEFKKILSDETVAAYDIYLKQSREEWQQRT